jgi:hypothetical protein
VKTGRKVLALVVIVVMKITTLNCFASVPFRHTKVINLGFMNRCHDFRTAEDYSNVPMVLSLREMNQRDIAALIPASSLKATDDGGRIATKILAQSLNSFFKSDTMKNSGVGRTATSVEKGMNTNVSMGGEDPGSTKHSFNFKMKATDARAVLRYQGFADAQISYQVGNEFKVSMFQRLNSQAQLVFDSISKSKESIQQVSLNLRF